MEDNKKITIEVTKQEHMMISAILLMHSTGFIVEIHQDKMPLLHKIANDFSLRNMSIIIGLNKA